jgi:hypothetical protein
MLEPGVRDELRQASEEAASASALVGQAMERVLEAELRMQNLVNRVRIVQGRPQPLPGG